MRDGFFVGSPKFRRFSACLGRWDRFSQQIPNTIHLRMKRNQFLAALRIHIDKILTARSAVTWVSNKTLGEIVLNKSSAQGKAGGAAGSGQQLTFRNSLPRTDS